MKNWKEFWKSHRLVEIKGNDDLLFQVAHTVGGKPISTAQFNAILFSIKNGLQLTPDDSVLDLCCGNGVFTQELAKGVKSVIGIDCTEPYIANARIFKSAPNIRYILGDVVNIAAWENEINGQRANKVVLCASLQYFTIDDLR